MKCSRCGITDDTEMIHGPFIELPVTVNTRAIFCRKCYQTLERRIEVAKREAVKKFLCEKGGTLIVKGDQYCKGG